MAGALGLIACERVPQTSAFRPEQIFSSGRYLIVDGLPYRFVDLHTLDPKAEFGAETTEFLRRLEPEIVDVEAMGPPLTGRATAARFRGDADLDLAEVLLQEGYARVWPRGESEGTLAAYFAREDRAREAGRGLWALETNAIRKPDPDPLMQDLESFQIVRGRVTGVGADTVRHYLNFGSDRYTDFTVTIDKRDAKALGDMDAFLGARIEVRGWITDFNGPSLWVRDGRAIRTLE